MGARKACFPPQLRTRLGWSSGEVAVFIILWSAHPSVCLNQPHTLPQTPPCSEASLSPHSGPGSWSPWSPRRPPRRVREVSRTMLCQNGAAVPRSAAPTTWTGVGAPDTWLENKARAGKTPDFTLKTTRLCGHVISLPCYLLASARPDAVLRALRTVTPWIPAAAV